MKRKLPPHIVLPNGQWRFVKRGRGKVSHSKRVVKIARRRGRFRSYAHRGYGRSGGWKGLIAPVAGGAGDVIIQKYIPIFGVGSTVAGMFLHDQITMKMGLNKIGESIGLMFVGNGGRVGNGGLL